MKQTLITWLARLEAEDPHTRWQHAHGLHAVLEAARSLPRREDPWALPDLEGGGSMAALLAEARRRAQPGARP